MLIIGQHLYGVSRLERAVAQGGAAELLKARVEFLRKIFGTAAAQVSVWKVQSPLVLVSKCVMSVVQVVWGTIGLVCKCSGL